MKLSTDHQEFLKSLCASPEAYQALLEFLEGQLPTHTDTEILDDLVANAPGMLYRFAAAADGSVRYEYISPNCAQITGVAAADALRNPKLLTDLLHPDDADDYWRIARRCAATLQPFIWEGRMVINGQVRWHRLESRPKPCPDGRGVIWNGIQTDTTLYREIEHVLRLSDERYRIIAEALIDYAFAVRIMENGEAHLDWIIGSYEANTGYTLDEIRIMKPYDLVHPDDREWLPADIARVLQGESVSSEYRLISKSGQERWIRTQRIPVRDAATGRVTYYYCVAQDITEARNSAEILKRQAVLQAALDKEIELNQLKSKMMTRISHEFRTPLAVIGTSVDMLENYHDRLTEEQRSQRFANIREQISRVTLMLDEIALILRGQDIQHRLVRVALDLNRLAEGALDMVKAGTGMQHQFILTLTVQPLLTHGDEKLLKNVLLTLMMNAVKYSSPGSQITVTTHTEDDFAAVSVDDEGIGIPLADQPRISQPFFRASNIGEIPGLGLGLAAAREVVQAHGGKLAFTSQQGQGTRFVVLLPLLTASDAETAPVMPAVS